MLISQQWPIAALAENRCARTVRVRCGASYIARIVLVHAWLARGPQPHSFPEPEQRFLDPELFLHQELCLRHLPASLCRAARDPIQRWREFWPACFLSASGRFIPASTQRDWRTLPSLDYSSRAWPAPTMATPNSSAPFAALG